MKIGHIYSLKKTEIRGLQNINYDIKSSQSSRLH